MRGGALGQHVRAQRGAPPVGRLGPPGFGLGALLRDLGQRDQEGAVGTGGYGALQEGVPLAGGGPRHTDNLQFGLQSASMLQ